MKMKVSIVVLGALYLLLPVLGIGQGNFRQVSFDFFGNQVIIKTDPAFHIPLKDKASDDDILNFSKKVTESDFKNIINELEAFKKEHQLDDWLYYQLIRKAAQQISPKAENYYRYTLYKWFLLQQSGYGTSLRRSGDKLLFYVRSRENIYNVPYYLNGDEQYVCLNYHDYGSNIDFSKETFKEISLLQGSTGQTFSYKITRLPSFKISDYEEKDIEFSYYKNDYRFKIKLNPQINTIFTNYPVVDYESYFNIPLSSATYQSLIPLLKENIKRQSVKNGVEYLMHFTRHAFLFRPDTEIFGGEKRFSPEQTLLAKESDCEDRAALFFYLVKEIYNLPMIVLAYPDHVTVAIKFTKPIGQPIVYNGEAYSICEPTPQKKELKIGQFSSQYIDKPYEIVYAYNPLLK